MSRAKAEAIAADLAHELAESEFRRVVDRATEVLLWAAQNQTNIQDLETYPALVRARYENMNAEEVFTAKGNKSDIIVGPKGKQRRIDIVKAVKEFGRKLIWSLMKPPSIEALEKAVGEEKAATVITMSRSGWRKLTPLLKMPDQKEAA